MCMQDELELLKEKYPFLQIGKYGNNEVIGIVQNAQKTIVSVYDLSEIKVPAEKQEFLRLGEEYWWNSNRKIGIDIFLKDEFKKFKKYLKQFNAKEYNHIHGPFPSLGGLQQKRLKRKQITLIRKMK